MKMNLNLIVKKLPALVLVFSFTFLSSCNFDRFRNYSGRQENRDFETILAEGKLRVVTDFNSVNYFIYKGQPMGFQYELLQELSNHLGIGIDVKVNNDLKQNFQDLENGKVDLVASNLTITPEREEILAFTTAVGQSRQVLVQRIPDKKPGINPVLNVKTAFDLGGKTVYVQKNSAHASRLRTLAGQISQKINIIEVPIESEQLIRMVSRKEIEYTVADEDIALVNMGIYSGLDISAIISFPQDQAWALRKESVKLKDEIDKWLVSFKTTRRYAVLRNKYYSSSKIAGMVKSAYYSPETGKISPYDEIIRREADKIGWDWRIIASMIYQESRFNHTAESHAGAFGIMQLMPLTAKRFGVDRYSTPEAHIKAGIKFIHWLDVRYQDKISDPQERIKFVLASYNVGPGHVADAMKLAEKYGKNPFIWEGNVEYYLLKKSDPKYFSDPLVRNGYLRGTETTKYVREVMYRYNHYLNIGEKIDLAQLLQ